MTLAELLEKRLKIQAQMRSLQDLSVKESREFTVDETAKWDKLDEEINSLDTVIAREEALAKRESASSELQPVPDLRSGAAAPASPEQAVDEKAKRMAMYSRYLRGGLETFTEEEKRGLTVGDDTQGGYLVTPVEMVQGILKNADAALAFRGLCNVVPLTTAETLGQVTLDTDVGDFDWVTEIAEAPTDTMKFGKRIMKPHPMRKLIQVSNKLIRLADPVSIIQERMGYKVGVTQEKAYMTGTGAGQPLGIFVADPNGIPTSRDLSIGAIGSLSGDHLIGMVDGVRDAYLPGANWVMEKAILSRVRKLKAAVSGDYLWRPGLTLGEPDLLLGYPVTKSEFAPNDVTSGDYIMVFGNFKNYMIVDAMDMKIIVLMELYQRTAQIGYIGEYEGDGQPVIGEAFKRMKVSA